MATLNIIGAILCGIISFSGLIAYIIYIHTILKHRRTTFSNSFYAFTLSLAFPDCFSNLITLVYGVPIMYHGEHLIVNGTLSDPVLPFHFRAIIGFSCDYFFFSCFAHMIVIAMNRVVAVAWPCHYRLIFSDGHVICIIICSYILALIIPIAEYCCQCYYEFAEVGWTILCENTTTTCAIKTLLADEVIAVGSIVFVLVCNVIILVLVIYTKRKMKHNWTIDKNQFKRELAMVIQFAAVGANLVMGNIVFWITPAMVENGLLSGSVATLMGTLCNTLQFGINPFIYFAFSSEVREKLAWRTYFRKKSPKVKCARAAAIVANMEMAEH